MARRAEGLLLRISTRCEKRRFVQLITEANLCLLVAIFAASATPVIALSAADHDRLIERARNGESARVIRDMQIALRADPTNTRLRRDAVVVANWAEDHDTAVGEYERLGPGQPLYVVSVAALSYRRAERWKPAIEAYRRVIRDEPKNYDAQAGLVHSLTGDGQLDSASALIDAFLPSSLRERKQKQYLPLVEALAILRERQERWAEALGAWKDVLELDPDFANAKVAIVFVASRLGAASIASDQAKAIGAPRIQPDAQLRLAQDRTAYQMRHGDVQLSLDLGLARFGWTDRALASNEADRKAAPENSSYANNAMFDRLIALRDRVRMDDALKLYEEIKARNLKPPPYALSAVADAYLYNRKPFDARDHYLRALDGVAQAGGKPVEEWQFALIYAYLECEQWQAASDLLDELLAKLRPFRFEKSPLQRDNPEFARARVMRALLDLYGDRLVASKAWLDEFLKLAPHDLSARAALASWYSANSMPNHASDQFLRIKAEDPNYLTGRLGLAETALSLSRWREARIASKEIIAEYPESRGAQRLSDILRTHDSPTLRLATQMTWPVSGGARDAAENRPSRADRDWKIDAYAHSMPIAEDYRLYAHAFVSSARFSSVDGRRERFGLGLERQVESLALAAELHADRRPGNTQGLSLSMSYVPSDEWRARLSVDTNSTDIALRASLAGIQARQFSFSLDRRYPLLRNLNLGLNYARYTDGNVRSAVSATWHERWISQPRYKLDMDFALYASRNTLLGVPYFNPVRDASIDATLVGEWLTWRSYERSFKQRLIGTAGAYWQEDFGTLPVLSIKYEHEWERQRAWGIRYGIGWTRRPYDGAQEQRAQIYLDVDWKLK
ncbi:MAG: poly-beta-1,6 N-acetyl-D-glucosamine export porin PgaA [Betaproteobacteria bacterium]|nr:MAG: poly-beta-1,6 N-acetyl-D-glucosamine export porin PgaA [Betaproteobacteria bacterium]